MAIVKSFNALRYHAEQIDLAKVVAPPYDIISEKQAQKLYESDPCNIIRLELCQPQLEKIKPEERYDRVAEYLKSWQAKKILVRDEKPGFYLHEMTFKHPFLNQLFTRLALYGRLKLEPLEKKVVFPHERTHASPKVDRGRLLRATHTSFSPVFFLYERDENNKVACDLLNQYAAKEPAVDFVDDMSTRNRFWIIDEPKHTDVISSIFWGKNIFIADGHHRYETALAYAEEMKEKKPGDEAADWNYVFGAFVLFEDPGLLILPIHRVIKSARTVDRSKMMGALEKYFNLRSASRKELEAISEGRSPASNLEIGLAFSEKECFILQLKDRAAAKKAMPEGKPETWYDLDMNLVSYLIVEPILQIENSKLEEFVFYTPNTREVFESLKDGSASCAFIIHPTTCEMIKSVCESGDVMPQKSTYFYPKLPSGLVMYQHADV